MTYDDTHRIQKEVSVIEEGYRGSTLHAREEEQGALTIAPVLPQALRRKGASYKIAPIQWGRYALSVECIVRDAGSFIMRLSCLTEESQPVQHWEWQGTWSEERKIQLA